MGCGSDHCPLPAHLWGLLLLLVVIASRWACVRRRAALTSLCVQLCVRVAVRLPVVRLAVWRGSDAPGYPGGGEEGGAMGGQGGRGWRQDPGGGAGRRRATRVRRGVEPRRGPGWKRTDDKLWKCKTCVGLLDVFLCTVCVCVSPDLFTLRLSVAFCASMRFMASAWLSSAHNCWPMATSSSYSFSPALQALLRLRTCGEKKG